MAKGFRLSALELAVEIDGEERVFRFGGFTGKEHRLYRQETGEPLGLAFSGDIGAVDRIAALHWLTARRGNPRLKLDDVLDSMTGDQIVVIALRDSPPGEEPPDPQS